MQLSPSKGAMSAPSFTRVAARLFRSAGRVQVAVPAAMMRGAFGSPMGICSSATFFSSSVTRRVRLSSARASFLGAPVVCPTEVAVESTHQDVTKKQQHEGGPWEAG